ncbi:MAG: PSD1 and planctomycete cytochrome C domain-containing protein [Planctomycetota bacterium]
MAQATKPLDTGDEISFNRDIKPILSDNCFACHGFDPETRESGLRLDVREAALAFRGGDGAAIVPGDHRASAIYNRITSDDPDKVMPPPEAHKKVSPEQADLLARWIDEGAEYEMHWAYVAPERPAVPEVRWGDWGRNTIDAFVLERLEAQGLSPSPDADPETLLRRVTRDLTGLPPTLDEIDTFLADPSEEAYAEAVERLLASPAFGERMAISWLDQVRYADTTGFHSDETQPVWAYRDYVVQAFNQNIPFDQFTREQLAGDLLPDSGARQKIASGFNRLNLTTAEGGAQPDEYVAKYMGDRVRAVSNVWMGATMGCAECHDHKYDPFTAKDYYRMGAFFADIKQRPVYSHRTVREPSLEIPTDEQTADLARLEKLKREGQAIVDAVLAQANRNDSFEDWLVRTAASPDIAEPVELIYVEDKLPKGVKTYGEWDYVTDEGGQVNTGRLARRQNAVDGGRSLQHTARGFKTGHQPHESDRWFVDVWLAPEHPPTSLMLQVNDGTWEHRAFWGQDNLWQGGIGVTDKPKRRYMGPLPATGEWVRLEVSARLIGLSDRPVIGLGFSQNSGLVYWDRAGVSTLPAGKIPPHIAGLLQQPVAERSAETTDELRAWYDERVVPLAPEVIAAEDGVSEAGRALKAYRKDKVYRTLITEAVEAPPVVRVLPRGNWLDKTGEVVEPGIPEFMGTLPIDNRRANRLDLAEWLVSDHHPLTRRVFVNRLWKMFYGRGLSAVLDDLGNQGRWPSHPELLDWLAVEFGDSGWDMKHMVRLMVTSRTYRQSSRPRPELVKADIENQLLGRQARFRVEAELIRDHALAVSGLLNDEMGGPPAKPYQPEGHWDHLNFPRRKYVHNVDAGQYRRGLYIHWQRTFLHPMLRNFDAPSREECTAERVLSNTPLQALTLLNDPTFVEAARVFAARIMHEGGDEVDERVAWAFRMMVARSPSASEAEVLKSLYAEQLKHYADHLDDAKAITTVGLATSAEDLPVGEHAAWTAVARALFNLHETITRD